MVRRKRKNLLYYKLMKECKNIIIGENEARDQLLAERSDKGGQKAVIIGCRECDAYVYASIIIDPGGNYSIIFRRKKMRYCLEN